MSNKKSSLNKLVRPGLTSKKSNKYRQKLANALSKDPEIIKALITLCNVISLNCFNKNEILPIIDSQSLDAQVKNLDVNHRIPMGILQKAGIDKIALQFLGRLGFCSFEDPRLLEYTTPQFNRTNHIKLWNKHIKEYVDTFGIIKSQKDFAIIFSNIENDLEYLQEIKSGKVIRPNDALKFDLKASIYNLDFKSLPIGYKQQPKTPNRLKVIYKR
jgi:hypothetical protein